MTSDKVGDSAAALRAALVEQLRAMGLIRSNPVKQAMLAVRRERFLPESVPLEDVYAVDHPVATKRDRHGTVTSSVSAAYIQAAMLEQAHVRPGMRVLEIGSGGLNAAYIAEIVGDEGHVISLDIDPDVTDRARALLDEAGYSDRVTVLTADAGQRFADEGIFDAILVTVGVWDIPPTVLAVLAPAGTIVVPLAMNGVTRTIAFTRDGDHLISTSLEVAGFVQMQGVEAYTDQVFTLPAPDGRSATLRFDAGAPADMSILENVLGTERLTVESGTLIGNGESFADLHLWLAWFMPGFCRVDGDETVLAVDGSHWFPFGVVHGAGVAYLVLQPADDGRMEFAACAYGRDAALAGTLLVEHIRQWTSAGRNGTPTFGYWPTGSDRSEVPDTAARLTKAHGILTISWPGRRSAPSGRATSDAAKARRAPDGKGQQDGIDMTESTREKDVAALRAAMVKSLRDSGFIETDRVAEAFNTVPRHLFAGPDDSIEKAYDGDDVLSEKTGPDGQRCHVISAPWIQAASLEDAAIEPGMSVLEIGSGGYNAALVAELVGPTGSVTTMDIDPEVVELTRRRLTAIGYDQVRIVEADAENGVPERAPFDRIIVTTGVWDIPPAWLSQLTDSGLIVVPLRFAGITRIVTFKRDGLRLVSTRYRLGEFVPVQGDGATKEQLVAITPDVALRLDPQHDLDVDVAAFRKAMHSPSLERWSGTVFDLPDEMELFVMTSTPVVPRLHASQEIVDQGVFTAAVVRGVAVLTTGGSFAYRTKRPAQEEGRFESGVVAYGPEAEQVAARYLDLMSTWATKYLRRNAAEIAYYPTATEPPADTYWQTQKRHGVLTVSWP